MLIIKTIYHWESVEWLEKVKKSVENNLDINFRDKTHGSKRGFTVTGIDFSKFSIDNAIKSATSKNLFINYFYKNYLEIDFENTFDVITLIYCDFGVLSPIDRSVLVLKINTSSVQSKKILNKMGN